MDRVKFEVFGVMIDWIGNEQTGGGHGQRPTNQPTLIESTNRDTYQVRSRTLLSPRVLLVVVVGVGVALLLVLLLLA